VWVGFYTHKFISGANFIFSGIVSDFIETRLGTRGTQVKIKTCQQFMYHMCKTLKLDEHVSDKL
jgi:hypothetical protein